LWRELVTAVNAQTPAVVGTVLERIVIRTILKVLLVLTLSEVSILILRLRSWAGARAETGFDLLLIASEQAELQIIVNLFVGTLDEDRDMSNIVLIIQIPVVSMLPVSRRVRLVPFVDVRKGSETTYTTETLGMDRHATHIDDFLTVEIIVVSKCLIVIRDRCVIPFLRYPFDV
jgi:hypothetical protein